MIALSVGVNSSLFTKRGHNKVMGRIMKEVIEEHRDKRLPRHFERNADTAPGGGYGYAKRSAKYQRRKAKRAGHQIPLVLTGRLKDHIQSNVRTTSTASRARLRTRGYFPMRVQMRKEIETFSRVEVSEIRAVTGLKYEAYAKKPEYQELRRMRKR